MADTNGRKPAGQALQVGDPFLVEDAVATGQFSQSGHALPAYGSCGAPVPPGAGPTQGLAEANRTVTLVGAKFHVPDPFGREPDLASAGVG